MRRKILYIEDDPDMADVVAEIMQFEDYEVLTDGGKGMHRLLRNNDIGLILMDEGLSWCWGSSLCKELRSDEKTAAIPIIMISAVREIEHIAEHCGADAYIRKPFEMYDVINVVNNHYPNG